MLQVEYQSENEFVQWINKVWQGETTMENQPYLSGSFYFPVWSYLIAKFAFI